MDLQVILHYMGISCYWQRLVDAGFETWEVLKDITESDMHELAMKLGHRRKLQRGIATSRGVPLTVALDTACACYCGLQAARRIYRPRVQNSSLLESRYMLKDSAVDQVYSTPTSSLCEPQLKSNVLQEDGFPWGVDFVRQ